MTYTHGESKLARVRAQIEAARLEEAQAMNALIRQHTNALRRRFEAYAPSLEQSAEARHTALLEAARLAQEWAETRWPEGYTVCRSRLDAAAREAGTIPDYRAKTHNRLITERSVSNADRSGVSRACEAA